MKNKRFGMWSVIFGLLLVLVVGLAVACAEPASEPAPTPAPAPAPTPSPEPAQPIELRLTTLTPQPTTDEERMTMFTPVWIDDVERATEGRVKISAFWNNTLAAPTEHYAAVVNGRAELASMYTIMTPGKFPMTDVFTVPSPAFFSDRKSRMWWELYQKFPEMNNEFSETKLLQVEVNGSYAGLASHQPIKSVADMEGLKVQAPGKWATKLMQAMGASGVGMPQTDVYMALQTKVIDAAPALWTFMPPPDMGGQGWGELCKYYTEVDIFDTPFYMVISQEAWDSLPPDIQDKIASVSGENFVDKIDKIDWDRHMQLRAAGIEGYGVEPIWLEPEELAKWDEIMDGVQAEFAADLEAQGLPGKALLEEYKRLFEEYKLEGYYGT